MTIYNLFELLRKFFRIRFLVCLSYDNGGKNHPISLKFSKNNHASSEIIYIVFCTNSANASYSWAQKIFSIHCGLWFEFLLMKFLCAYSSRFILKIVQVMPVPKTMFHMKSDMNKFKYKFSGLHKRIQVYFGI